MTIALLVLTAILVLVNGFFVAAEFAMVKTRPARIEQLIDERRPFAKTAGWLMQRLEPSLSACQLGITMASLALGRVGEPAFSKVIAWFLEPTGLVSERVVEPIGFAIAFTVITALHLIIGEQAPKIFAIRRPEVILLLCAAPLKAFYILSYPLMAALNWSTAWLLAIMGLKTAGEHTTPYTEAELRGLLQEAQLHGYVSRTERELIDAVFDFDSLICRRIMLPRNDIDFVDINDSVEESLDMIRRTRHSRYPVCDGSLDEVIGVVHIKDLVARLSQPDFTWKSVMRPPRKVPENLPVNKLLRHFQATHQHMAFVIDEYGTIIGVVTLENVYEEILGNIADEFDSEDPDIVPDGEGVYIIEGTTAIDEVEDKLGLKFEEADVDTIGGLLMHKAQRLLSAGDELKLAGARAKVLSVADDRVIKIRFEIDRDGVPDLDEAREA